MRSRTFFFGTFERLDISRTQSAAATVPSAAFRRRRLLVASSTPILDPSTGQPFPGNRIPASRINPVAAKLLADVTFPRRTTARRFNRYTIDGTEVSNQFDMRLDQNFSQGHTLFGRFSWKKVDKLSPTTYQSLGPRTDEKPNRTLVISDNFAIRPNLLNEARFGYTVGRSELHDRPARHRRHRRSRSDAALDQPARRHRHAVGRRLPATRHFGENQEEPLTQDTWQIADNVTWLKGRHTMKGGFDIKWFNWTSPVNFTGADDFGVFRFNNNIQGGGTGHPFANFLLGLPTDVDQTASGPNVDGVATHYGFFVQDEWRVEQPSHAQPRPPLRAAAAVRGSRGEHQQLPARHAQRRRGRARRRRRLT